MAPRRSPGITEEEVAALATSFPEVTEGTRWGNRTWLAGSGGFAWMRPFSKADVRRFGDQPVPEGPILALATEDLAEKAAVLEAGHDGVFTIEHLDGYPAILVQLDVVERQVLKDLLEDAWLAKAPAPLAAVYLEANPD